MGGSANGPAAAWVAPAARPAGRPAGMRADGGRDARTLARTLAQAHALLRRRAPPAAVAGARPAAARHRHRRACTRACEKEADLSRTTAARRAGAPNDMAAADTGKARKDHSLWLDVVEAKNLDAAAGARSACLWGDSGARVAERGERGRTLTRGRAGRALRYLLHGAH